MPDQAKLSPEKVQFRLNGRRRAVRPYSFLLAPHEETRPLGVARVRGFRDVCLTRVKGGDIPSAEMERAWEKGRATENPIAVAGSSRFDRERAWTESSPHGSGPSGAGRGTMGS